jgi:uncharacterized protein (DUF1778 family)
MERVEVRLLPDQKGRIEHAARIKGISVSEFLVQSADQVATSVLEENRVWILGKEDSEFFANALLNPGEPSPRLKASVAR